MILPFKQYFPWHTKANPAPTYFREKILSGVGYLLTQEIADRLKLYGIITHPDSIYIPKLHTIRAGNRWKAGDLMHMAYGVRTKNYQQFNKGIPELEMVKSVQEVEIKWKRQKMFGIASHEYIDVFVDNRLIIQCSVAEPFMGSTHYYRHISGSELGKISTDLIAINDGFVDLFEFFRWFNKDFTGQIIHFTDLRY